MKRVIIVLSALAAMSSAFAANRTWTGNSDGKLWATAGNWNPSGSAPKTGETAIFNLSGPALISLGSANRNVGGVTVNSGDLCLETGALCCTETTSTVFVAEGASFISSNNWYESATYSKTLLVKGTGDKAFRGIIGYATSGIKQFKSVVFSEGSPEVGAIKAAEVVVGEGVCLNISAGGWTGSAPSVIADGATLRFMTRDMPQAFDWPTDSSTYSWKLKVGEGGARVDGIFEQTFASETYRQLNWYATAQTADGIDADGGIVFDWPGVLTFYKPQSVKGPVAIRDGFVTLREDFVYGC